MTKESIEGTIHNRLIEYRPDVLQSLLAPLREGNAVWLEVKDKRLPKKTRAYKPVLVICPVSRIGVDASWLLVSMPPYGSELVNPRSDLKATVFARLGLSFSLASALARALRNVL